jgi:hypothetical protein
MQKLDYFPEVENMVELVMLITCKMLEFTNTLSRECTGFPQLRALVQKEDDCFGEPNMCAVGC